MIGKGLIPKTEGINVEWVKMLRIRIDKITFKKK